MGGGAKAGMGLGGLVVAGIIVLLMGGDPSSLFRSAVSAGLSGQGDGGPLTEEEIELGTFAKQVLAGTEDAWTAIFAKQGLEYQAPRMVLYTGATSSGCGNASSSIGPFYCSADQTVYIDLSFFSTMKRQLGADGDFAYAYVIAHEVGHHVQYLLGTLDQAHQLMRKSSKSKSNEISVRLELQADYYAGVWAFHDDKRYGSLEEGDIDEALDCASKIGDDYLQKKSQGYVVEDSFTHGTAKQRRDWLKKGLAYGDLEHGDTFSVSESL